MTKSPTVSAWMEDPRFQALSRDEQEGVVRNYFDRNLVNDNFTALGEYEQQAVRSNFVAAHLGEAQGVPAQTNPHEQAEPAEDSMRQTFGQAEAIEAVEPGVLDYLQEGWTDVKRNVIGTFKGLSDYFRAADEHALASMPQKAREQELQRRASATDINKAVTISGDKLQAASEHLEGRLRDKEFSKARLPQGEGLQRYVNDVVRMAPQIGAQIATTVATGPAGATAFMGSQIAGGKYLDLEKKGVEPMRAFHASLADATLQAPLEAIGISKALKFWKGGGLSQGFRDVLGAMGTEFVTEWMQKYPEAATEIWAMAEQKGQTPDEQVAEFFNSFADITKAGVYEGMVAAPFGGGTAAISAGAQHLAGVEPEIKQERQPSTQTAAKLRRLAAMSANIDEEVVPTEDPWYSEGAVNQRYQEEHSTPFMEPEGMVPPVEHPTQQEPANVPEQPQPVETTESEPVPEAERVASEDYSEGDSITVYDINGNPYEGHISAISDMGTLRIEIEGHEPALIHPDSGSEAIGGFSLHDKETRYGPGHVIGSAKVGAQGRKVSDLTDQELQDVYDALGKAEELKALGVSQGAGVLYQEDVRAVLTEQARRKTVAQTDQKETPASLDLARVEQAYRHTSLDTRRAAHVEQGWFESSVSDFRESLAKDLPAGRDDDLEKAVQDFSTEYLKQREKVFKVRENTVSSAVAGRSKFNSKQAAARSSALDKAEGRFVDWMKSAKAEAEKTLGIDEVKRERESQRIQSEARAREMVKQHDAEQRKANNKLPLINDPEGAKPITSQEWRETSRDYKSIMVSEDGYRFRSMMYGDGKGMGPVYITDKKTIAKKDVLAKPESPKKPQENVGLGIHLNKFPSGRWGFVGTVPGELMYVDKETGGQPSQRQLDMIAGAQSRALAENSAGVARKSHDTPQAALEFAKAQGIDIPESNIPDEAKAVLKDTVFAPESRTVLDDGEVSQEKTQKEPGAYTSKSHDDLFSRVREGKASPVEVKQGFAHLAESKESIAAELGKLKRKELLARLSPMGQAHNKYAKKSELVDIAYRDMVSDFALGEGISYNPFAGGGVTEAVRSMVEKIDDDALSSYAEKVAKARAEYMERLKSHKKALENPETYEEFEKVVRFRGADSLTAEQRIKWDELQAERSRAKRAAEKERKATVTQARGLDNVGMTLHETKHTRDGHDLFVVKLSERVEKDVYRDLLSKAKQLGGWYSRYAKGGAIPGFQFKTREAAGQFMALKEGDVSRAEQVQEKSEAKQNKATSKLRSMAENMKVKAEESLNADRKVNTHRRVNMAEHAEREANKQLAMAETMRNLADAIESGAAKHLDNVTARTHVELLESTTRIVKWHTDQANGMRHEESKESPVTPEDMAEARLPRLHLQENIIHDVINRLGEVKGAGGAKMQLQARAKRMRHRPVLGNGYLFEGAKDEALAKKIVEKLGDDAPWQLAESLKDRARFTRMGITTDAELRSALREFLQYRGKRQKADPIKKAERELVGVKIDGYFPTPKPVVERMLEEADIDEGMKVLEPSAGKGNIADLIKEEHPGADLDVIEFHMTLRDLLKRKGHDLAGQDFLEHEGRYDRIVMNPPFEHGQDMQHVQHAFDLLNPGGRVVAIMSEGPFFRNDKQATAFRDWLEIQGGTSERLPEGSFKSSERQTGVATRLVVIDKPGATAENALDVGRDVVESKSHEAIHERQESDQPARPENGGSRSAASSGGSVLSSAEEGHAGRPAERTIGKEPSRTAAGDEVGILHSEGEDAAHFEVREASDLIPSHDANQGFIHHPNYPDSVQERPYHRDASEQQKVKSNANRLDSRFLLNDNPDAINGPPIITRSGIVLGGNSRTMTLQYAFENLPEKGAKYVAELNRRADIFGIDQAELGEFKQPVLVRVVEDELSGADMARKARLYNQAFTQSLDSKAEGVSLARMVSEESLSMMARAMGAAQDMTMAKYLSSPASREMVQSLRSDGIITDQNENRIVASSTGLLNEDGRKLIVNTLRGKVIDDFDLLDSAAPSILNKIDRALPAFAKLKDRGGDWDVSGLLKAALRQHYQFRAGNHETIDQYFGQASLLDNSEKNDPDVVDFTKLLHWSKPTEFGALWRGYVKHALSGTPGQAVMPGIEDSFASYEQAFETLRRDIRTVLNKRKGGGGSSQGALFSKGLGHGSGIRAGELRLAVTAISQHWENPPKVTVVQSESDLPADLRGVIERAADQGQAEGCLFRGDVFLVADNLSSMDRAMRTVLRHEVFGHYGLRSMLGEEMVPMLKRAWMNRSVHERAQTYMQKHRGANRLTATEEALAEMAAEGVQSKPVDELIAMIRDFIRKVAEAVGVTLNLSDAEIRQLLARAREHVEGGQDDAVFIGEPSPAFSQQSPVFYSQMGRALAENLPGRGPGKMLATMVQGYAKKGLFKQEELEWSGLVEWLQGHEGKVSKDEVLDFVKAGGPVLEEVTKQNAKEAATINRDEALSLFERDPDAIVETVHGQRVYPDRIDWIDEHEQLYHLGNKTDGTKYSNYQLPGGENYREVLLTLPVAEESIAFEEWNKNRASWDEQPGDREEYDALVRAGKLRKNNEGYKSSHWDEPNVLAHMRLNDRVGSNGERILFIEEIQSDWHQAGRKKGYRGEDEQADINAGRLAEIRSRLNELHELPAQQAGAEEQALWAEQQRLEGGGVPNAPFKKSWHLLAFKRVFRMAAEQGYDSVAWTPGEVQNERYDLSKQVGELYHWREGDEYGISAYTHDRQAIIEQETFSPEKLESAVGKEIAEKIIAQEGSEYHEEQGVFLLQDDDLKIGGEGMKGFYDNILPKEIGKYVKKLDKQAKINLFGHTVNRHGGPHHAKQVHVLPITDKMRSEVLGGQPMFSQRDSLEQDVTAWQEQLDEYEAGTLNRRVVLNVGATPDVLQRLGADALPMIMPQSVLKKAQDKHSIPLEVLRDLPAEIADPIMVFDSATMANSFVVLTEMQHDGENLVVPIHMQVQNGKAVVHEIASIHDRSRKAGDGGKVSGWKWVVGQARQGRLRFLNQKKYSEARRMSGLQLPGASQLRSNNRILTEKDIVKPTGSDDVMFSRRAPEFSDMEELIQGSPTDPRVKDMLNSTDLKKLDLVANLPHWISKRNQRVRDIYERQLRRLEDRTQMFRTSLEEVDAFFGAMTKQDTKELSDLIWHVEGQRLVEEDALSPVLDEKGREVFENGRPVLEPNEAHYSQLESKLRQAGFDGIVLDTFMEVRRSLDKDLLRAYDALRANSDVTDDDVKQYRTQINQVHMYFPHHRYGKYFVRAVGENYVAMTPDMKWAVFNSLDEQISPTFAKQATADKHYKAQPTSVLYREHFDAPGKVMAKKKANAMIKNLNREYPFLDWSFGENKKLPEDVYDFPIPTDAMEQIISAAANRVGDEDAKRAIKAVLPEAVADVMKSRGWGAHSIRRLNVRGYERQDVRRVLYDYKAGLSGWLTKMDAAKDFSELLRRVDAKNNPREYKWATKYIHDMLSNADEIDRIVGNVKALAFFWYLGGNIKTAALNLTQNIIVGWPRLSMETGMSMPKTMKGMVDAKVTKAQSEEDVRLLQELFEEGLTDARYLDEVRGRVQGLGWDSVYQKILNVAGIPMSFAEKWNRAGLALAAFRAMRSGQVTNEATLRRYGLEAGAEASFEVAKDFARETVNDAHFVYGKSNLPGAFRGQMLNKILSTAYTFRTFSHNLLSAWAWMFKQGGAGKKAVAKSLMATFALGGLTAMPFYHTLMALWRTTFGDDDDDLNEWMHGKVPALAGDRPDLIRDMLSYGLPSATGFTMGGSLGMEMPVAGNTKPGLTLAGQIEDNLGDIIGIPYDLFITRPDRFQKAMESGDIKRAVEALSPTFLKNLLVAERLFNDGQTALSGKPLNLPGEKEARKLTLGEAAGKVLGFQPTSSTKAWEVYQGLERSKALRSSKQREIADRMVRAIRGRDGEAMTEAVADLTEWNQLAQVNGKEYLMINTKNIKQAVKSRMMTTGVPKGMETRVMDLRERYRE